MTQSHRGQITGLLGVRLEHHDVQRPAPEGELRGGPFTGLSGKHVSGSSLLTGATEVNARRRSRSYAILIPLARKKGMPISAGTPISAAESIGETDAPTDLATPVTPAAAERSSGVTTAIV